MKMQLMQCIKFLCAGVGIAFQVLLIIFIVFIACVKEIILMPRDNYFTDKGSK